MKWLIQIGLETDHLTGLFSMDDLFTNQMEQWIKMGLIKNHVKVIAVQYDKLSDEIFELKGINNHSGGRFDVVVKDLPVHKTLFET